MPTLIPSKLFLKDVESFQSNSVLRKKIAKAPYHAGAQSFALRPPSGTNHKRAWSVRINGRYRLSFDPGGYHPAGNPDWNATIILLRLLDHDDLYKSPQ